MKLLLYCTKAKPYLTRNDLPNEKGEFYKHWQLGGELDKKHLYGDTPILNGKIVAECDFEVEKINVLDCTFRTFNLVEKEILNKSCLTYHELFEYLKNRYNPRGYAIHIKNLHIFDEPRNLDFYSSNFDYFKKVEKAPQNMMRVWEDQESPRVLISIKPEWLCKILNGEKTIEVRKKVLKEMLE